MINFGYRTERSSPTPLINGNCSHCGAQKLCAVTTFLSLTALWVPIITLPRKQIVVCEDCRKETPVADYIKSNVIAPSEVPPPARYSIFHFGWVFGVTVIALIFSIILLAAAFFFEGQLKLAENPQVGDVIVRELKIPFKNQEGEFSFQLQRVEAVHEKEVTVRQLNLGVKDPSEGMRLYEQHRNDSGIALDTVEDLNREKYANMSRLNRIYIIRMPKTSP